MAALPPRRLAGSPDVARAAVAATRPTGEPPERRDPRADEAEIRGRMQAAHDRLHGAGREAGDRVRGAVHDVGERFHEAYANYRSKGLGHPAAQQHATEAARGGMQPQASTRYQRVS